MSASTLRSAAAEDEGEDDDDDSDTEELKSLLSSVPLLTHLSPSELSAVADVVTAEEYDAEAAIVTEGESGEAMFFLEEGEARAYVNGSLVREYSRGDFFGEMALLLDQPRKATVRAGSDGARCLMLDRAAFDTYASGNTGVLEERQQAYAEAALEEMDEDDDLDDGASTVSASTLRSAAAEDEDDETSGSHDSESDDDGMPADI